MARRETTTAAAPAKEFGTTLGTEAPSDLATLMSASLPDAIPSHLVSDHDLDVLTDTSTGELGELKWAVLGAVIGTLPAAAEAIYDYATSSQHAVTVLGLFQILIFAVSLAVWLVIRFAMPKKQAKSLTRRDEIRARSKSLRELRPAADLVKRLH